MIYLLIVLLSINLSLKSMSFDQASTSIESLTPRYDRLVADATATQLDLESIYQIRGIDLPAGQYVKKTFVPMSPASKKEDNTFSDELISNETAGPTFDSASQQAFEVNQKTSSTWRSIHQTLSALNLKIGNPEPNDLKDFFNIISKLKTATDLSKQNNNLQKNYTTIVRRMLPNLLKKYTTTLDQIIFETIHKKSLGFTTDGQKQIHSDPNSSNQYSETDLIVVIKSWINKNLSFSRVSTAGQSSTYRGQSSEKSSNYQPSQSSRRPSQSSKKTFKR
jgi:hypothetical protein